ncbi:hypothetical protein TESG_08280 [Trichophyton tonsurans CBS 112818]|uniref:Uncharacterized protein n=1 Tax=Trichophyton tonsurans (strain CBS 112818) TaxID=647933 RepID=F2RQ48_TRIT1|nr:hypothetical protein TESG_08280 [Trichophyton tonsurans CBS 112818]
MSYLSLLGELRSSGYSLYQIRGRQIADRSSLKTGASWGRKKEHHPSWKRRGCHIYGACCQHENGQQKYDRDNYEVYEIEDNVFHQSTNTTTQRTPSKNITRTYNTCLFD